MSRPTSDSVPRFPQVLVDVDPASVEEASALFFELDATGVEERDATTLVKGAPGKVTLVASFADPGTAAQACASLGPTWHARVEEIVGDAWRDDWKKHFRPFELFPGFVVRPPWEGYAGDARHVIVLEPGRAFGTGLHETTTLVAEQLDAFLGSHTAASEGPRLASTTVLDVGCGSGVLSIVALKLGAPSVRAIDVDPDAVLVTRENAERNGLLDRVQVDVTPIEAVSGTYGMVVANIEAGVLAAAAPAILRRVAPGGVLVLSGILAPSVVPGQLDEVLRAFAALELVRVPQKGEWVAAVLRNGTSLP